MYAAPLAMLLAAIVGFLFGYLGSIPVAGPIAILVLARGLSGQFRSGLFIAAGSAVAEGLYAFLAFWGFGALLSEYPWIEPVSRGAGAVILLALGILFLQPVKPRDEGLVPAAKPRGTKRSLALGFTVTAMNPTLIATWTAAVTALYGTGLLAFSELGAVAFASGAVVGIAGWFATMLGLMHRLQRRFQPSMLEGVRRAMGALLVVIGLWFVVHFAMYFV